MLYFINTVTVTIMIFAGSKRRRLQFLLHLLEELSCCCLHANVWPQYVMYVLVCSSCSYLLGYWIWIFFPKAVIWIKFFTHPERGTLLTYCFLKVPVFFFIFYVPVHYVQNNQLPPKDTVYTVTKMFYGSKNGSYFLLNCAVHHQLI